MYYWGSDEEAGTHSVFPAHDVGCSPANSEYAQGDLQGRPEADAQDAHALLQGRALAPIGVFDSGAGGFTILSALRQELPHEHYIYFGDTAYCPYGVRSDDEITALTTQACHFLITQGVKLIVIACNTASQAALTTLRATFSLPFVGVVPAVKLATRFTKRGRVGVAATNQAARAAYLRQLIDDYASGIQVYAVGCPELVTLVEQGELAGPLVEETLSHALHPVLVHDIDVLVLGCTHFPALRPAIEHVVGRQVLVIDSGTAIARRTRSILDTEALSHPTGPEEGALQVWCSGDATAFSRVASKILGYPALANQVTL